MSRIFAPLALLALGAALQGCVVYDDDHDDFHFHDDPVPAELRLNWVFPRGFDCFDAGVTDILIQIEGQGSFQEFGFVRCELGYVDIPSEFPTASAFWPGRYYVTVLGYPPRGGSAATWAAEGWIDLYGGFNEYSFGMSRIF